MVFGKNESFMQKGEVKIYFTKDNDMWVLPEMMNATPTVATLRMEIGGKADPITWHKRLGHISNYKAKKLVEKELVPKGIETFDAHNCQACNVTNPHKRPVPKHAERSGEVTAQVDYMPMGHDCKGLNGEVGVYVCSSRY